jgi:hypothetical protein
MRYCIGEEYIREVEIEGKRENYRYFVHPHHRNGNNNKSQWLCSIKEEIELFELGAENKWKDSENVMFSIFSYQKYIGISWDKKTRLFFSKFISADNKQWHGYPADYIDNPQDRPGKKILGDWRFKSLIRKSHIKKILKGKPC